MRETRLQSLDESVRSGSAHTDVAVVLGNRAGVVEWADDAWTRLTGFPLDQTIEKPITHFLERAGIEVELVDFVGQHFLEGRSCTLEFPFQTFDGRSIDVHLEVEPIRNDQGEISEFRAVARESDVPMPQTSGPNETSLASTASTGSPAPRPRMRRTGSTVSLADTLAPALDAARRRARQSTGHETCFDIDFDPTLPSVDVDPLELERLFDKLLTAARENLRDGWGCVTVLTGRTRTGRSHRSQAYPIPARPHALAQGPHLYLEVHDNGHALDRATLARIRAGEAEPGMRSLQRALETAQAMGAVLHLDSTPGCGNQALVLFPLY